MRRATILVLFCVLIAPGLLAQTFVLSGTVVDPAGRPIPGVAMELRLPKGEVRRTVSDAQGAWTFDKLQAGQMELQAAMPVSALPCCASN